VLAGSSRATSAPPAGALPIASEARGP
jgi:hypothetical protein